MISIAYLGPQGTYSEQAAIRYGQTLQLQDLTYQAYPSIPSTIQATAQSETDLSIVPVENSIGGSVDNTLDTLWTLDSLQIKQALVLPIEHRLISWVADIKDIQTVYSHPQALAQCQQWLAHTLPTAKLSPTSSTTEALTQIGPETKAAAIASSLAANLYQVPIVARAIADHRENYTKFWVLSHQPALQGSHTSLGFSLPKNTPGALLKPLQLFATQNINMSRIESRPTKRTLGDYHFFIDIEASLDNPNTQAALQLLKNCTETLKVFGSYTELAIDLEPEEE
ncbi:MAG: prephenate dehydratase [Cyanobacteria bacterium P01_F01_bin.4]